MLFKYCLLNSVEHLFGFFFFLVVESAVGRCSALNWDLHLYCLLIGAGSLIAGLFAKLLPDSMFSCINLLSGNDD